VFSIYEFHQINANEVSTDIYKGIITKYYYKWNTLFSIFPEY